MTNNRKTQLINLGADILADALLEVAQCSEDADKLIDRLDKTVSDWQGHLSHHDYYQHLRQNNARKSSF